MSILTVCGVAWLAVGVSPVTKDNWRDHPDIVAVRAEFQKVEALKKTNALSSETREYGDCLMYQGDMKRTAWRDGKKKIRLLVIEQGSDDSSVTLQLYYDEAGKLRFVFILAGAVNDSSLEHRIWFSPTGQRLWEEHNYVAGPGYTFPRVWPDEELARNAEERWKRALKCEHAE